MVFLRWLTANARGLRAPPSTTGRTRSRNCSSNSMSSRRRQRRFLPSNRLPKSRLPMLKSGCAVCSVVISSFNENSEFFGAPLRPCPAHCHRGHVIRASETDALRPAGCVPGMLIRELTADHIYLACGHTDMQKSIDGLAALVVSRFHLDPHQPALFLFCGRRKDRIKGLLWDETGFLLLYKRLEDGKYQWPDEPKDVLEISEQQLRWLTEGLTISLSKPVRKIHQHLTI